MATRRGFIASVSLGAVSLYGVWAGLGAAPLRFWEPRGPSGEAIGMAGSGGHEGHGGAQGPSAAEFRRMAEEFIARHRQSDGSVFVDAAKADAEPKMAGHSMPGDDELSADVYIAVEKWSFDPSLLRLRAGLPYRFKLMALDAAHGAAFQLGLASHVIRLPKGVLVERGLVFTRPGQHLLYCTVYCGEGHQYMAGQIEVI